MAEPAPAPRSPLAALADALAGARADGVTLAERPARARLNLRLDPEDAEALAAAAAVLGGALPLARRTPPSPMPPPTPARTGRSSRSAPTSGCCAAPAAGGAALAERARRPRSPAATTRSRDVSAMYATLALCRRATPARC